MTALRPTTQTRGFARRHGGSSGSALSLIPFGFGPRWRHDPFTDVFKDLERLSNELGGFNSSVSDRANWAPRVDVKETDSAYEITVELPGLCGFECGF